jgi:uncharacterized membrane protein YdbT with pleckstrin-like domain
MSGIGLIVSYLGYAVLYWALQSFQGNQQSSFISYILPFAPKDGGTDMLATLGDSTPGLKSTTPSKNPPANPPPGSNGNLPGGRLVNP